MQPPVSFVHAVSFELLGVSSSAGSIFQFCLKQSRSLARPLRSDPQISVLSSRSLGTSVAHHPLDSAGLVYSSGSFLVNDCSASSTDIQASGCNSSSSHTPCPLKVLLCHPSHPPQPVEPQPLSQSRELVMPLWHCLALTWVFIFSPLPGFPPLLAPPWLVIHLVPPDLTKLHLRSSLHSYALSTSSFSVVSSTTSTSLDSFPSQS